MIAENGSGGKDYNQKPSYERTISLRFLGIILRVLRLEISIDKCLDYKPLSNHFFLGVRGEKNLLEGVTVNIKEENS